MKVMEYKFEKLTESERMMLLDQINDMNDVFTKHFDVPVFNSLLEAIHLDHVTMREIRNFLSKTDFLAGDEDFFRENIRRIDHFIHSIRYYLLPNLKERLSLVNFQPFAKSDQAGNDQMMRKFLNITLPHNTRDLEILFNQFKDSIEACFPGFFTNGFLK